MPEFKIGDVVVWPNGIKGVVMGVDHSDATLLDDCGAWHAMFDVDAIAAD